MRAAPHCFGETVVPQALTLVRAACPQLDLELVLNDRIVDVVTEGVDISFRLGQLGEGVFIARQHGPITEPSDLVKHPFIRVQGMFGANQLPLTHTATVVKSVPIQTVIRISHWRPVYEMILSGLGIGALEEPACVDALAAGWLVRMLPGVDLLPFELHLLSQTQCHVPTRVRQIVKMVKKGTG